jgi:glyoxylase I family protein
MIRANEPATGGVSPGARRSSHGMLEVMMPSMPSRSRTERRSPVSDPTISSIQHVTLNVHDPERSEQWYSQVLNFSRLAAYETPAFKRVILRHPSGIVLGLNKHDAPEADVPFNERRAGLGHLAFQVPDREQLEAWVTRFDKYGVTHSEIKPGASPGSFLVAFRDRDDIQLEVFAPA